MDGEKEETEAEKKNPIDGKTVMKLTNGWKPCNAT